MNQKNPIPSDPLEADRIWVRSELGQTFIGFCDKWRDKGSLDASTPKPKRLMIGNEPLGWLHGEALNRVVAGLRDLGGDCANSEFEHCDSLQIPLGNIQNTLTELGGWLHARQWVPAWRDEMQTVHNLKGEPLFELERGLFKMLGLRSQAVHIHIETPDGLVWVGRRSIHKKENPGMLDNLSAGGMGAGETAWSCVWRELDEEAGLYPADVNLEQARTPILVSRPVGIGWHHETIYLFKGIVPRNWTPKNRDGEVQGFELMTRDACVNAVNQWRFTPDAGLVTALLLSPNRSAAV